MVARMAQEFDQAADAGYAGSIPAIYDMCLGQFLFAPYADDLVSRAADFTPATILETAAGTGIVSERLSVRFPEAQITATDLNSDMLHVARLRTSSRNIQFKVMDAQDLNFEDGVYDLVACQFGAMFFPDPVKAYAEARRMISTGGTFMFSVWDRIEANPASHVVELAVASMFPMDPPMFLSRTPYGYYDEGKISYELQRAGFTQIEHRLVEIMSEVHDPQLIARGLCEGCPLGTEIQQRRAGALPEAMAIATQALLDAGFNSGSAAPLRAHLWIAGN